MLWETFSWASLGFVVVVELTINATDYVNIITDHLHPYMVSVFRSENDIFVKDNTLSHYSNSS